MDGGGSAPRATEVGCRCAGKGRRPLKRGIYDALADMLFPRRCVHCGATGGWLCGTCRRLLSPLTGPRCRRCGRPLEESARHCIECRGRDLAFVSAAAAYAYEGPARSLVAACKFRRLRPLAGEMATLAGPRFAQLAAAGRFTTVTWTPTTPERLRERGFDQAEALARALACQAALPASPLLRRTRAAHEQSGLGRRQRAGNVRGAFACLQPAPLCATGVESARSVPGAARSSGTDVSSSECICLQPMRVLIVDDVYTTGETLNECATALSGAGYEAHVFTFARTVRGHPQ